MPRFMTTRRSSGFARRGSSSSRRRGFQWQTSASLVGLSLPGSPSSTIIVVPQPTIATMERPTLLRVRGWWRAYITNAIAATDTEIACFAGMQLAPPTAGAELPFTHGDSNRWFWWDTDVVALPATTTGQPVAEAVNMATILHQVDSRGKRKCSEQDEVDLVFQISPLGLTTDATISFAFSFRYLFLDS